MKSRPVGFLLAELGVTKSFSRPQVSNDNPFSEAQFKTLKYCPEFPERFGSQEDAISFCRRFFNWYNTEHRHSGIGYYTPEDVHYGRADEMEKNRNEILAMAFARTPERFVMKRPVASRVPAMVWINPPQVEVNVNAASGTKAEGGAIPPIEVSTEKAKKLSNAKAKTLVATGEKTLDNFASGCHEVID